jgi:hypothetical protein
MTLDIDARLKAMADAQPSARQGWVTIGDLLSESEEPPKWLVDGMLPEAGTSLLVAKPKVGKSTLAQNLLLSVALGEPFLGREVMCGPVLYLAHEEKRAELRRRFRAMGAQDGDRIEFFISRAPEGAIEWLRMKTEERKPVLIVVDTFQRFARLKDLNDYAAVTNALDPLTHLARESGAHLMLVHHEKKAGGNDGDGVLGSTGLFGGVDTLLVMRRRDGTRSLSSMQRYGQDLEATVLQLDAETYRLTAHGTAEEADRKRLEDAIVDYLGGADEGVEQRDIFETVEGRRKGKIAALKGLTEDGRVLQDGAGKKGDPFRYALPENASFLVPTVYREPENQNPETTEKPSKIMGFSSSHNGKGVTSTRNQNNGASLDQSDLFAYAGEKVGLA